MQPYRHGEPSEAIQARGCGGGLVWIASLSLAMTELGFGIVGLMK